MSTTTETSSVTSAPLSIARLNAMRVGYLLMGVGLVIVKWPQLPRAHDLPVYEGVTLSILVAMSVLAFLGVRHPVALLPVLVFETLWKALWLGVVALPAALSGELGPDRTSVLVNCSLIVVIAAVTPWRYAWRRMVRAAGDPWR